ncbi:MAG TPA: serine/threonine-protein kinase [Thermoanaerobaculia bacterium]|nr:serine/threonine-protein kinase [Thermoanaerobaculia bacterium]
MRPPATLEPGARLGPYEIIYLIGRGGMGEVYRATDTRLGRQVAVKILPSHLADHPEALARFRREARAVAALSHGNIVSIFDVGEDASFVVTELLDGETLRARLERGRLPIPEALRIAAAIADGLAAAHAKGIIHRDLKPDNVFLMSTGGVKILDFGLASTQLPFGDSQALTEPGMVMGTLGYMSPEQLRGRPLTPASDVFSFGCVVYEMLRGEMPFRRDSQAEVIASVLTAEPLGDDSDLPDEIHYVLQRCLEKDPTLRFQSGAELAGALRTVVAVQASGRLETMPTMRRRRRRTARRFGIFIIVIAVIAALLAIGSAVVARQRKVIDGGYDLRMSDVSGTDETRRLTAVALRADAAGNRAEAIELFREATRSDPHAPLPPAFLSAFTYFSGDRKAGARFSAETRKRLAGASSSYEALLARYLLPENDGATQSALASSLLELRPKAWRLRLSLAHRHLDRREMRAMLAQLLQIDVSAPDDRRLTIILGDRASLGDIDGAERDLQRSRLTNKPALLAYTKARIAWSRGRAADAAKLYAEAAEAATVANLPPVANDCRVLAGIAQIGAGDFAAAQTTLDLAAVRAHQAALVEYERQAYAFGAYAAYRRGDDDGMRRRLRAALALVDPGTTDDLSLRSFALRMHEPTAVHQLPPDDGSEVHAGVPTLLAAREAWALGDKALAARLLQQARAEGVDTAWFAEEAALLAKDLGEAPRPFRPDPPYPNHMRFIAVWELAR